MRRQQTGRARGALAYVLIASAFLLGPLAQFAPAAEPDRLETSLKKVPADAAFYSSFLRGREQLDILLKSKALAKLKELPAVQDGLKRFDEEYKKEGSPFAPFRTLLDTPDAQELLGFLGDAVSNEVFLYGTRSWADVLELWAEVNVAVQFGPLTAQLSGPGPGADPSLLQAQIALQALSASRDRIAIPELVLGFKVSDVKRAEAMVARLETLLDDLADKTPQLKGRIGRTKLGGVGYLTLKLDGSLIPWDDIPWNQVQSKEGEFDPLIKKLKALKLTLAVGVRDGYVLLSMGPTMDHLARFAGKEKVLAEQPEFQPIAAHADKPITSVHYVSRSFNMRVATAPGYIDGYRELLQNAADKAGVAGEQRTKLRRELLALSDAIKKTIPEAGAQMAFSFRSRRGTESYAYDWGKIPGPKDDQAATLLAHVGGDPLFVFVGERPYSSETHRLVVKCCQLAYEHGEPLLLQQLDEAGKTRYEEAKKLYLPLLESLEKTTSTLLLPGLGDGQIACVLDARWKSMQWVNTAPKTDKEMPLPEPAVVLALKDADKFTRAMQEYRKLIDEAMAKAKELDPNAPGGELPKPETKKVKGGTLYFYPIPAMAGLDEQVVPTAGLSDAVVVLALSHDHAERLLADRPFKPDGGPLAVAGRRRGLRSASYLDFRALVEVARPWVTLALENAELPPEVGKREDLLKDTAAVLEFLKLFRGFSSATYREKDAVVTHTEMLFDDLK